MNNPYRLSHQAVKDHNSIIDYTIDSFGVKQARKYLELMEACAQCLANAENIRYLPEMAEQVRFIRCQNHYIFGIIQGEQLIVIAIIHEKRDWITLLEKRIQS